MTAPETNAETDDAPLWRDLRQELSRPAYGLPFQDPPLEPEPEPEPDHYADEDVRTYLSAEELADDDVYEWRDDEYGKYYLRRRRTE